MRSTDHPLLTELLAAILEPQVEGDVLAHLLGRVAEHEIQEGGPYTATIGERDADIGLNLGIAVFLGQNGVRLEQLDAFIDTCVRGGELHSAFLEDTEVAQLIKRNATLRKARSEKKVTHTEAENRLLDAIRRALDERLSHLPRGFKEHAHAVIERTIRGNTDKQMALMPLYVREALGKRGSHFTDERLAELGLASIFFWTAFIIYDDFWDEDEAAEPKYLPIANLFARHFIRTFEHTPGLAMYFHELMDLLDAANEWEMLWCRLVRKEAIIIVPEELPDYGDYLIKFYPAAGHVLGTVAMFGELGYAPDSEEVECVVEYFKHYLVAMQLNDDAHDWKEDLARGHISTAVAKLLEAWKEEHPDEGEIDLEEDMPELERLFWFRVLTPLCESVLACTSRARASLAALDCIEYREPLERFITENERIAKEALAEHRRSVAFLDALA